ncbi:MAG: tryptophan synthase subunit alpha [Dehalococcoidales bacterium]|nr:tryptophan synthase subunit alpha [Dehalococcoidales bacterium]
MSRIENVFSNNHTALIAYVTTGYPDIESTLETVPLLAEKGCDIIELGIPFSDPLADGVTIQNSSYHALMNGVTVETCLETAVKLREKIDTPLVFMTYYNPVYRYGIEKFCKACADSGIDGLIIPDMPPEEGGDLEETAAKNGLDVIYLLAPTSNDERIRLVTEHSHGFVYLVSVTGVTGARSILPSDLEAFIGKVRKVTDKPLCVGFGISTPEQAGAIGGKADGVIIGSRIIQYMESGNSADELGSFISGVRKALG